MFYEVSWVVVSPLIRSLWRVNVEGREHVPKKGAAIFASNHLSVLDHFVLGSTIRRPIHYISKAQHFDFPVRRFLFRRWGVIPLKRGEGDRQAFDASLQVLAEGNLFGIYPEGTRSLDGKLHRGHTGVARLHLQSGAPIIPVAMLGTFEAMPKGKRLPNFHKCGVRFGPALDFSEFRDRAEDRSFLRKITDEVMAAIAQQSGQEYVDEYQFNPEVKTQGNQNGGTAVAGEERQSAKPPK